MPKKNSKKNSPKKVSPRKTKVVKKQGSKAEVMHGTALQTSKGLKKEDLIYNRNGSIVSKKKSIHGHRTYKEKKPKVK
jgi:hypothetical protein